jgi:monofunctional glycosyltransferase
MSTETVEEPVVQVPERRWWGPIRQHPFLTLLAFVLCSGLLDLLSLPFGAIGDLRTTVPRETAFMREHAAVAASRGRRFRKVQTWIPLRQVPREAINAVIVAEDGTFWQHHGFDWYEFRESMAKNVEEGRPVRGASTISQQLVKNLFLSSSKNPLRKLNEWILTWYLEQRLTKSRILELYLNLIEWGEGIYGVEAASQYYFDHPAATLTREESARLAAIIPSPRSHRADVDSPYVLRRSQAILERLEARGW